MSKLHYPESNIPGDFSSSDKSIGDIVILNNGDSLYVMLDDGLCCAYADEKVHWCYFGEGSHKVCDDCDSICFVEIK